MVLDVRDDSVKASEVGVDKNVWGFVDNVTFCKGTRNLKVMKRIRM